ncbi:hypothetical protein GO755_28500 [Spirosoma sp. HMF4905]|uniref:Uncharacterized protein n=1 Tax=Spirosoma arboris TaxID=2682092 RepID=A0A7K1SJU6_9BACT|nr:hypothetical protein [Spirosoma arboris]MVM34008.1 hypothetical protein [Spirosoma arboris]
MKFIIHCSIILVFLWAWVAQIDRVWIEPNGYNRLVDKPSTLSYRTDSVAVLLSALDSFQVALDTRWSY